MTRLRLCTVRRLALLALTGVLGLALPAQAAPKRGPGLPPVPTPEWFDLDGSLRTRWGLLINPDLDRGLTPTLGQPIYPVPLSGGQVLGTADARVRLDLGVHVGEVVSAHVRIDALDGLVLGSTPDGFPADRWAQTPWAGLGQQPQTSGRNSFVDSIRLEYAYGQVLTPIGLLVFGRMPLERWGLGMVTGRDEDLDDDFDVAVDRLGFVGSLGDHLLGITLDVNAVGPTTANTTGGAVSREQVDLELQDNLYTATVSFLRDHDGSAIGRRRAARKPTISYGAYATFRWQVVDFPTFYLGGIDSENAAWGDADAVQRRMWALLVDGWTRVHAGPVRVELEVAYSHAHVGDASLLPGVSVPTLRGDQLGVAGEVEVEALDDKVFVELGVAVASGDPAPGLGVAPPVGQTTSAPGDLDGPQFNLTDDHRIDNFRFHPNFRVDQIFWRRIVGAISDAFVLRPELTLRPNPALEVALSGTASFAMQTSSTPGNNNVLGGEIDLGVRWTPAPGFEARLEGGVFLPGPGLANTDLDLAAQPAGIARTVLAVLF